MARIAAPSKKDIVWLFDDVYPGMERRAVLRDQCVANIDQIKADFRDFGNDADKLLQALVGIDGVGLVVGSGLIYCANRDRFVPFDKYTMGYALYLKIFLTPTISTGNYNKYSDQVTQFIKRHQTFKSILDFVRAAEQQATQQTFIPFPPD